MARRHPWESRPLLDDHPWSLLPVIGLSKLAAVVAQVAWLGFVLLFATLRPSDLPSLLPSWLLGAWFVFYITQRLGGRDAMVGGAAPRIRPDSTFQVRLVIDVLYVVLLIVLAGVIALGPQTVRGLLAWL
jgi:hypothetical protein